MGKTNQLGVLADVFTSDASNNVGIGGSPSGTYKLEVTGTAKVSSTLLVSGAATFSSTISTGGALNITVPYSAGTMTILTQDNLGNGIYLAPRSNLNFDYGVANNTTGIINNFGYQNGSAHFRSLGIGDGKGGTIAFFDGVNSRVGIGATPLEKFWVNLATNVNFAVGGTTRTRLLGVVNANDNFCDISLEGQIVSFYSAGAERMRITSGGSVIVQSVRNNTFASSGNLQIFDNTNNIGWGFQNNTFNNLVVFSYNGVWNTVGYFTNGTGVYVALSDANKKKDFEDSTIGLKEVLQLKPTLYRMKSEDETTDKHLGFIAQEVKDLIPQAYNQNGQDGDDDIFIGLTEMPIIAALVKAIQELSAQNQDLKSRLDKAGL